MSGHSSSRTLEHYRINVPWLDRLLQYQPIDDRPFLTRLILADYATDTIQKGEYPGIREVNSQFSPEVIDKLLVLRKNNTKSGMLQILDSLEICFWKKIEEKHLNPRKVDLDKFDEIWNELMVSHNRFRSDNVSGGGRSPDDGDDGSKVVDRQDSPLRAKAGEGSEGEEETSAEVNGLVRDLGQRSSTVILIGIWRIP